MNPDTGEIYELPRGETYNPRHIQLTDNEARYLKGREHKDRLKTLKRLRRAAIRAAKRENGGRLSDAEAASLCGAMKENDA